VVRFGGSGFNPLFIREKLQGLKYVLKSCLTIGSFNPLFIREKLQAAIYCAANGKVDDSGFNPLFIREKLQEQAGA